MRKPMSQLERKLAMLSADVLPYLGTAVGAAAGGVGAPVGSAIGSMAGMGIRAMMPPEQQMQQQNMMRPMVVGGQGQGYIDLDQQMQQQGMMDQMMQGDYGPMQGLGQGLGQMAGQGMTGLLSMLGQPSPQQKMWGKMDDSLREKLVRMVALKQVLGQ